MQANNRGAAYGRQPQNQREVLAPHEVFVPEVFARMIEVSQCTCHRVKRTAAGESAAIAAHTGKCKVIQIVRSTDRPGIDVID